MGIGVGNLSAFNAARFTGSLSRGSKQPSEVESTNQEQSAPETEGRLVKLTRGVRLSRRIGKAIQSGDIERVQSLTEKLAGQKLVRDMGAREAHWMLQSAALGEQQILEYFIDERGVHPDSKDSKTYMTALGHAAGRGDMLMTGYLLNRGAKRNLKGGAVKNLPYIGYSLVQGNTELPPLSHAIVNKQEEVALYLIEKRANVDLPDANGVTPLMYAALAGQTTVMKELVRRGADLEALDANGTTVLMMAAAGGHVEALKFLLEDLDLSTNVMTGLAAVNKSGLTKPLGIAKSPSGKNTHQEQNALMLAIAHGNSDAMKYLVKRIQAGVSGIDLDTLDKEGWPALMYAAKIKRLDMLDYLLDAGANPVFTLPKGDTLLTVAARNGWADMVRRLLKTDIDINADDAMGFTALMHAVWRHNTKMAALLREHGAELRPADKKGALYLAEYKTKLPFISSKSRYVFLTDPKKIFKRGNKKPPLWDPDNKPPLPKRLSLRFSRFTELSSQREAREALEAEEQAAVMADDEESSDNLDTTA